MYSGSAAKAHTPYTIRSVFLNFATIFPISATGAHTPVEVSTCVTVIAE